jgi:hypothetical protein
MKAIAYILAVVASLAVAVTGTFANPAMMKKIVLGIPQLAQPRRICMAPRRWKLPSRMSRKMRIPRILPRSKNGTSFSVVVQNCVCRSLKIRDTCSKV